MKSRREKGREAANRRWHGAEEKDEGEPIRNASCGDAGGGDGSPIPCGNAKGNEKEGNEKEITAPSPCRVQRTAGAGDDGGSAGCAPVCFPPQAVEYGLRLSPPCPEQWSRKWWEDSERRGWLGPDGLRIVKWQPALSSYWRGVQEMERRICFPAAGANEAANGSSGGSGGTGNGSTTNGQALPQPQPQLRRLAGERSMSAYEIKTRMEAIDDELARLRLRAKDGRSEDGLRSIKIYTPGQRERRDQLLHAKEALRGKLVEIV